MSLCKHEHLRDLGVSNNWGDHVDWCPQCGAYRRWSDNEYSIWVLPDSMLDCKHCEGAGRWRADKNSKTIQCHHCQGTGRQDLQGDKRPLLDTATGKVFL